MRHAFGVMGLLVLTLCLAALASAGFSSARAAQDAGCDGSWLVHITVEGRDVVEDALVQFDDAGDVVVYGPPVMPALPGPGEVPLQASAGLGTWQSTGERECAFEFVRLLADDDGIGVGTLNVRGSVMREDTDDGLEGSLTMTRSTPFGQTAATSEGTLTGTSLDGPLLWLTPTGEVAPDA
jgi:hypothetical protein